MGGENKSFRYLKFILLSVTVSVIVISFMLISIYSENAPMALLYPKGVVNSPTFWKGLEEVDSEVFQTPEVRPIATWNQKNVSSHSFWNSLEEVDSEVFQTPEVRPIATWNQKNVSSPSLWNGLEEENVDPEVFQSVVENYSQQQKGNFSEKNLEWEEMMAKRFSDRRVSLKKNCANYKGSIPKSFQRFRGSAFLYSEKYDFLVCINAKGGATTWKTHLLKMNGYTKIFHPTHSIRTGRKILAGKIIGKSKLDRKMHSNEEEVIRVISVRNPFSRLVSAYVDKFHNGTIPTTRYKDKDMYWKALKLIGNRRLQYQNADFPFDAFLRSVIKDNKGGAVNMNRHWRPYCSNCQPCHIPYDYIVKQETFEEDLRYLVQKFEIDEIDVTTRKNIKSSTNKLRTYEDYYKDISDDILVQLYPFYKDDFYLFDYDLPQFMKDALSKTGRSL